MACLRIWRAGCPPSVQEDLVRPMSRGARAVAFGSGRFIKVAMSMILIATGLAAQTGSSSGSSVWQSNSPTPPPTSSNAGAGTLYRDAHGAFSIMIPEGWAARPNVRLLRTEQEQLSGECRRSQHSIAGQNLGFSGAVFRGCPAAYRRREKCGCAPQHEVQEFPSAAE